MRGTWFPGVVDEQDLVGRVRDATYAAVGLGVLGAQRLAVRRRELAKEMEPKLRQAAARAQELAAAGDGDGDAPGR